VRNKYNVLGSSPSQTFQTSSPGPQRHDDVLPTHITTGYQQLTSQLRTASMVYCELHCTLWSINAE